jgi:hypothetical protein
VIGFTSAKRTPRAWRAAVPGLGRRTDLADPAWNTSGVPWHTLYYGANYPAAAAGQGALGPRNVFHHTLAVATQTVTLRPGLDTLRYEIYG